MSFTVNVTPLYERILVREVKRGDVTAGGIIVPQMVRDNTPFMMAEVLAVGCGRLTSSGTIVPLIVKPGDLVVIARTSGTRENQIFYPLPNGEEAMIVLETHVCHIFNELPVATGVLGADGKEIVVQPAPVVEHS